MPETSGLITATPELATGCPEFLNVILPDELITFTKFPAPIELKETSSSVIVPPSF